MTKEYNINNENKLTVGDKLKDQMGNHYLVVDMRHEPLSHSQYASEVLVECLKGKNKGRTMWVDHYLATQYKI